MGNSLKEINQRIQRDKQVRVHSSYIHQLSEFSEQQKQSPQMSEEVRQRYDNNVEKDKRDKRQTNHPRQAKEDKDKALMAAYDVSMNQMITQLKYDAHRIVYNRRPNPNDPNNMLLRVFHHTIQSQPSTTNLHHKYKWHNLRDLTSPTDNGKTQTNTTLNHIKHSIPQFEQLISLLTQSQRQLYCGQLVQSGYNLTYTSTSSINSQRSIIAQKVHANLSESFSYYPQYDMIDSSIDIQSDKMREDISKNRLLFNWRVKTASLSLHLPPNDFPIVHVYQVQEHNDSKLWIKKANFFSTSSQINYHKVQVYQQFIPYRLKNVRTLSHLQGVYVLEQVLRGMQMLYEVVGSFSIDESMIGFTWDGIVKVWLSSNFHTNLCHQPHIPKITNQHANLLIPELQQHQMVTTIWMIVQKYTLFSRQFMIKCGGFRRSGFKDALGIINRHKSGLIRFNPINQSPTQSIKFVTRIKFQHDTNKKVLDQKDKRLKDKEFFSNNVFLLNQPPHITTNPKTNTNLKSFIYNPTQELNPTPILTSIFTKPSQPTQPSLSSHITILTSTNHKRRRAIFDKGYEYSMQNNRSNAEEENNQCSIQRLSQNQTYPDRQHATFVTIKSQR